MRLLVSAPSFEPAPSDDPTKIGFRVVQDIYGIVISESTAMAPDGTLFDPRTLVVEKGGAACAISVAVLEPPFPFAKVCDDVYVIGVDD